MGLMRVVPDTSLLLFLSPSTNTAFNECVSEPKSMWSARDVVVNQTDKLPVPVSPSGDRPTVSKWINVTATD